MCRVTGPPVFGVRHGNRDEYAVSVPASGHRAWCYDEQAGGRAVATAPKWALGGNAVRSVRASELSDGESAMYITRKHISRRTALRGVGVTLALPWLEAMMPAQTPIRQSAAQPGTRFAALEMVHGSAGSTAEGTRLHYWSPKTVGRDFETLSLIHI